jgi:hypothetical protein
MSTEITIIYGYIYSYGYGFYILLTFDTNRERHTSIPYNDRKGKPQSRKRVGYEWEKGINCSDQPDFTAKKIKCGEIHPLSL